MIYVPGCGNPNARLMVVGEAPGAHEEANLEPFVGPAGVMVREFLSNGGLDVSEVYLTNVVKVRPPDNKIHRLPELGVKVADFEHQLWEEIRTIKPNAILAFGNTALKALTGETGIKNYRGSILPNCRTGLPKVIPTIHPSMLLHSEGEGQMMSMRDKVFIQFDVNRAIQQSLFPELKKPERLLHICKSSLDLIRFIERNAHKKVIDYDIETFKAIPMCIGFAFSRHEAISIPLFDIMGPRNEEGIPMSDMAFIWKTIGSVLMDPQFQLIGHNLKFDQGRLEEAGILANWPYFDTQLGFHTIYPELPKRLAFVSSVLTEEPYYKDELEEYNPKKDKLTKRLLYNAKDCAVGYEVYEREIEELKEIDMLDWYFDNQNKLHKFYYEMERRGIMTSPSERKRLNKKYDRYIQWIERALEKDLGYKLNVNSPKQVAATLFGDLKCPVRRDTSEDTLEMLMVNAVRDERRQRIIRNILRGRKGRKTKSTYVGAALREDGAGDTIYNITGTETGRTSTSKPKAPVVAKTRGFAFQTMTKHGDVGADLRKMFIPRPGKVIIECDGGQAEDRVVCNLACDLDGLAVLNKTNFKYNSHKLKDDRHTLTAMMVLSLSFEEITDDYRQIGKKTRHAGNYKMGKRRLSQMVVGESNGRIMLSEWKAGKCLEKFHADNSNISCVFWEEINQALRDNDQVLKTPHGRRRQFFDRWGDDLLKEAYAYIPQATVSDHTKFAAIRVEERAPWIEMIVEAHDSFTAEVPEDRVMEAALIMKEEYEVPIDFSRCSLPRDPIIIPAEIQVAEKNWKEMRKLKVE